MPKQIQWATTEQPRVMNKMDARDIVVRAVDEDAARRRAHDHKEHVIFRTAVVDEQGTLIGAGPWEVDTDL